MLAFKRRWCVECKWVVLSRWKAPRCGHDVCRNIVTGALIKTCVEHRQDYGQCENRGKLWEERV